MSNYVDRFSTRDRVLHWTVTAAFFILFCSGLGLYSRLFNGWFNLFGGGQSAILFHKIAGIVFFVTSLMLFLSHKKEVSTFDEDDRDWIARRGGYLSRNEAHFNSGKFNAGQKLFGIFVGASTIAFGVSGVVIWTPLSFPRGIVQFSLLLHGLTFVMSIMFVIVHVYLATIGNPGTLEGMLWGGVRKVWALKHHPNWYREVRED